MPSQINPNFLKRLTSVLGESEAEAVLYFLLSHITGKSKGDLWNANAMVLSDVQLEWMKNAMLRLEKNEPIQYILGTAHFLGLDLEVNSSVLIPRPETEELAHWVLQTHNQHVQSVLDVCTGSGCIALALRKLGKWKAVSGLDVSPSALEVARRNTTTLKLDVDWIEADILTDNLPGQTWDVIVSNPPYVLPSEAVEMTNGVLHFEPNLALFTPENDPILFYKAICNLAVRHLKPDGVLYFELNPKTATEVTRFLQTLGFEEVEVRKDMSGKERMLKACLATNGQPLH